MQRSASFIQQLTDASEAVMPYVRPLMRMLTPRRMATEAEAELAQAAEDAANHDDAEMKDLEDDHLTEAREATSTTPGFRLDLAKVATYAEEEAKEAAAATLEVAQAPAAEITVSGPCASGSVRASVPRATQCGLCAVHFAVGHCRVRDAGRPRSFAGGCV